VKAQDQHVRRIYLQDKKILQIIFNKLNFFIPESTIKNCRNMADVKNIK
jgi:hypothetical protein